MKGMDCSGFVQLALGEIHLDPPGDQTAEGLRQFFKSHGQIIAQKDADLGDIVFYGHGGKAHHVALCLSSDLMQEAGGGGPSCTSVAIANKLGAKVKVSRINRRSDLLCIIRPNGLPWRV